MNEMAMLQQLPFGRRLFAFEVANNIVLARETSGAIW